MNKKVLMVISLLNYGGASKMFITLANYLVENNYEVTIYSYIGKETNENLDSRVNFIPSNITSKNGIMKKIMPIFNIRKILKKNKPDVLVTFLTNANFYVLIAKAFLNIPIVISERSDPYYESNVLLTFMRKFYVFADKIVFQTQEARDYFNERIKKNSVIIPNPIKNKKNISLKKTDSFYKISFVGRFDINQKRQDLMVDAFQKVLNYKDNIKLYFYGDGPDFIQIKNMVENKNISSKVIFEGRVDNVLEEISDSTIYILTSDFEGIPNSLMEAMSIGLPVISTDCSPGGARLLINNKENGIIIPRGNAEKLSDSILHLIDNPKLRQEIGYNAKNVNIRFEETKIMQKWLDII